MLNFDWISSIDAGSAKLIVLITFLLPLIFALTLKKNYIFAGAENNKPWRNLKIWVTILTGIMLIIYSSF
ncbi:MAG: hypothetical protein HYS25_09395 [Ignavibacteriales bacterium]|nr:hypothetical protein [Ignavibacteriales bacterium]